MSERPGPEDPAPPVAEDPGQPAPWARPPVDGADLYADLSQEHDQHEPPGPAADGVPGRPVRRRRTALVLAVAAVALVAGGMGGAAGALLVEGYHTGTLVDPAVELPAPAPGSTARPADSIAGIVAAVAPAS